MQYTSRAAQLYKATLEKDVKKLSTQTPVSPTAAEASKRGIDFLDVEVRPEREQRRAIMRKWRCTRHVYDYG